jgi:predicted DsbA family dithiol-disulfide isomerase
MTVQIDVVSDVVCPWCFIGKRQLTRAVALTGDIDVAVVWRPYQLDPALPADGVDRKTYMAAKFPDTSKRASVLSVLTEAATAVDLELNLAAIEKTPNTLNAHRLIHWARGQGLDGLMVERLMSGYFLDGQDIGDADVLTRAAQDIGMEPGIVARLLASESDVVSVQSEARHFQQIGVTGVPCFIFNQKFAVMGAQPAEALADAIRQAHGDSA